MKIGVDLDGVIVDSIRYWIGVLNREAGMDYRPGDLPDTYSTPELAACCDQHELEMLIAPPPMAGADSGLKRLKAMGHTLVVLTARASRLRSLTEAWLTYHGLPVDSLHFLQGGSKAPVARAEGLELMVEDTPHHALAVCQAGVPVLLFAAPYNEHVAVQGISRCRNWDDVVDHVRQNSQSGQASVGNEDRRLHGA